MPELQEGMEIFSSKPCPSFSTSTSSSADRDPGHCSGTEAQRRLGPWAVAKRKHPILCPTTYQGRKQDV